MTTNSVPARRDEQLGLPSYGVIAGIDEALNVCRSFGCRTGMGALLSVMANGGISTATSDSN